MKKLTSGLLTLLVAVSMISCQKEISNENGQSSTTGVLKMKIDGAQWVAEKVATAAFESGSLTITGLSNDNKGLLILLNNDSVATYTLDQQSINFATVTDTTGVFATDEGQSAADAGGQVIITKIDTASKTITGTFVFNTYRNSDSKQLVITEGSFTNLPYTGDPTITTGGGGTDPDPAAESFGAKVNGTAFSATTTNVSIVGNILVINAIEGSGTTAKVILLSMPSDIAAGAYQFEESADNVTATYSQQLSLFLANKGTLTITEHNTTAKTIKGSFSFEAPETGGGLGKADVTEGSFSLSYQ